MDPKKLDIFQKIPAEEGQGRSLVTARGGTDLPASYYTQF